MMKLIIALFAVIASLSEAQMQQGLVNQGSLGLQGSNGFQGSSGLQGQMGGTGGAGGGGFGGGMRGHGMMSMFQGLDDSTKQQFQAVFQDRTMNREQKMQRINQLAQQALSPQQYVEFQQKQAERQQRMQQRKAEMDQKIAAMSPNAQNAAQQIKSLMMDHSLDWNTKRAQMDQIKAGLSDSEKAELQSLRGGHRRWGGGRGMMGGSGEMMGGGLGGPVSNGGMMGGSAQSAMGSGPGMGMGTMNMGTMGGANGGMTGASSAISGSANMGMGR